MIVKSFQFNKALSVKELITAQIVNKANEFQANIEIEYSAKKVNLKSIIQVMNLSIQEGDIVKIFISGKEKEKANQEISGFIQEHLGDELLER
ncbi:putative phosphocarrier protein HPr [Bacillus sp. TS-2]|nr:putative phosphocarrier protein HPr [Bacillus sp. TS-2]